jgi:hypothetical protein
VADRAISEIDVSGFAGMMTGYAERKISSN